MQKREVSSSSASLLALADRVLQPGFGSPGEFFYGTALPAWLRDRLASGLGSVLLYGRNLTNLDQTASLTAAMRAENPDVLIAIDEESGDVTRLEADAGSSYPGNLALGTVDDLAMTHAVGRALGADLRAAGVSVNYAPVADVETNPGDSPIGANRSFGSDPKTVARHVAAWVHGLHEGGIAACVKHFPGHGSTDLDSHFHLPTVPMSREQIRDVALPPFRTAIDAGARAVMVGHLLVPAYDTLHPATASRGILQTVLRKELGFGGLVVSDAIDMKAMSDLYGRAGSAIRALYAGVDLICLGSGSTDVQLQALRAAIVQAVRDGSVTKDRLVDAAMHIDEFAEWSRQLASDCPAPREDRIVGLTAARRAVRVTVNAGRALPLQVPPHVVEFSSPIGSRGVYAALSALMPGTTQSLLARRAPGEETDPAAVLASATGRPLVLCLRNAHGSPALMAWMHAILRHRADTIIVELGAPRLPPSGAAMLTTFGAARVCCQAAAELLLS